MLLFINDKQKEDLKPLGGLAPDALKAVAEVAAAYAIDRSTAKVPAGLDARAMESAVAALASVLLDAARNKLAKADLKLSLASCGIAGDGVEGLADLYESKQAALRESLATSEMTLPRYKHLDWRLDIELSSRMLHRKMEPKLVMRLDTVQGEVASPTSAYFECDFANLKRISSRLREASEAMDTAHAKRVARYIH